MPPSPPAVFRPPPLARRHYSLHSLRFYAVRSRHESAGDNPHKPAPNSQADASRHATGTSGDGSGANTCRRNGRISIRVGREPGGCAADTPCSQAKSERHALSGDPPRPPVARPRMPRSKKNPSHSASGVFRNQSTLLLSAWSQYSPACCATVREWVPAKAARRPTDSPGACLA